jgi:hypothetical protein
MTMAAQKAPRIEPLNPLLYGLLEHKFGEIKIANEGASAHVQRFADPTRAGRSVMRGSWGEYYCVCCPFCRDDRNRLWINHRYGADVADGRRVDTNLAICYNENCLEKIGRLEQLEDMIFGAGRRIVMKAPIRPADAEVIRTTVEPPGDIVSLADLPDYHPAIEYLARRGFSDVGALVRDFDIGVCTSAHNEKYRIMRGRLYIPVYFNRQLVGWQGRVVGNPKTTVKYYNGLRKSQALYNYDAASKQACVVIVEGVPSVWRLGAAGVCIFGKTLSAWQLNTIVTTWAGKPVFVMLDYDAQAELEQAVHLLCRHNVHVVPVIMPDDKDPADYTRQELRELLSESATAVDVVADLSFLT